MVLKTVPVCSDIMVRKRSASVANVKRYRHIEKNEARECNNKAYTDRKDKHKRIYKRQLRKEHYRYKVMNHK